MLNSVKNKLVLSLYFGKVLLPARRIGQLLGSNPSAEAGDVGMGPYFIVRPFFFSCLCRQCVKSRGFGGWPPFKSVSLPLIIKNVLPPAFDISATGAVAHG